MARLLPHNTPEGGEHPLASFALQP
jgi:hypothetical protein